MIALWTSIRKEFVLVFRDIHSVLVLFAMPAVFIVIMSLAMQDQFGSASEFRLSILYIEDEDPLYPDIDDRLEQSGRFDLLRRAPTEIEAALESLREGEANAMVHVPGGPPEGDVTFELRPIEIWLSPQVDGRTSIIVESSLREIMMHIELPALLALQGVTDPDVVMNQLDRKTVDVRYAAEIESAPTAVQQSVPAWLIFSMFFVVIPIATTLITEKDHGTIRRLRTMNVSMSAFLIAKILPYLVINQIQLILMLALGIWVVPLLGGDRLAVGGSVWGLGLISLGTGFAAVSYGLMVAVIARTTEQATAIGGVGNILLAAIGGIMVPKFIMPEYLQVATNVSPMAWGLEGFLDVLLRGGGTLDVLYEFALLTAFGCIMLGLSIALFIRRSY